jgi:hypothetical protein
MSQPPMSPPEIDALMREVSHGAVAPKTAISLLLVNGVDSHEATRRVFHALGGSSSTASAMGDLHYSSSAGRW